MSGVNKVTLVGNLGRDPEVRALSDRSNVVTLSVATSEDWRDKHTGEKRSKTEWHRVVIFNPGLAKVAADYLKKGERVYIEGALQTRKWTDQSGQDKYSTEVVLQPYRGVMIMLSGRGADHNGSQDQQQTDPTPDTSSPEQANAHGYTNGATNGGSTDLDDEIPF